MIFNIAVGNNPPHLWDAIGDLVSFLRAALEAKGHAVLTSDFSVIQDGINIFIDRFFEQPELASSLRPRGIRYGMVVTEHIDAKGVLNFGAESLSNDFIIPVQHADFVWCLMGESLDYCRTLNAESHHLPLGYVPALAKRRPAIAYKDIDFVLTGRSSPRRQRLLGDLGNAGFRTHCTNHAPSYIRDGLLDRAKFNLSIQKMDGQRIISVTRICHSILNRVPVILEIDSATAPSPLIAYCLTATTDRLVDQCAAYLREIDVLGFADGMLARFAAETDMAADIEPLLLRLE